MRESTTYGNMDLEQLKYLWKVLKVSIRIETNDISYADWCCAKCSTNGILGVIHVFMCKNWETLIWIRIGWTLRAERAAVARRQPALQHKRSVFKQERKNHLEKWRSRWLFTLLCVFSSMPLMWTQGHVSCHIVPCLLIQAVILIL